MEGLSSENIHGLVLAISSSIFIGSSFIIKKKGLKKSGETGTRASSGGHSYLREPLWWAGFISMIIGEIANFAAYAFAPAILVTPLGALSIIVSALLAHFILEENLHIFGMVGCVLCLVGSTTIVLHAPQEREINSVKEVWHLATEPGFLVYAGIVFVVVLVLIFLYVPRYGRTHMIVYIGICSLTGSLMALDTFNTAVVSPVYYVMFTTLTIIASMIMFKEWDAQNATQIATELCGFLTILCGTFLLHKTKDMGGGSPSQIAMASPVFHTVPSVNMNGDADSNSRPTQI
ncbi:probable magnesium transporter NIPA2 isoform X3 [Camellia sinensis]|uniref:probable magnesium transporter NIPA2 isoform X3 n=1 Tax=Camellia sinensis TaxID=4442 RepID=UPI00103613A4|nr:probable magnesium transporter NIPA2 isoform X3 [Camellia sinensis]